jgi:putative membrane protein
MTTALFIPLEGGWGPHGEHFAGDGRFAGGDHFVGGEHFVGGPPPFLDVLGDLMGLLLLLLVLGTAYLLARRGTFGPALSRTAPQSPESEAKRILAERFARGEIDTADFMERASVLNWTPGSDIWENRKPRRR